MEVRADGEIREDSSIRVLQQLSEEAVRVAGEAVRVAGEALNSVSSGSSGIPQQAPGHKRVQSEVVAPGHRRSSSFSRWKSHVQKALRWGGNFREQSFSHFDPEILANQKRQWYQLQSKTLDHRKYDEPALLFEHFIIVGLHPDTNLEPVECAFAKRKKWESQVQKSEFLDHKMISCRGPSIPILEPRLLFKYPPGKRLAMRPKDLAAFCFPGGIKTGQLEKTPSLSELNELVYGKEHMSRDDLSFIFSLKVADNATLYGICVHVREFVQGAPAILGSSHLSQSAEGCSHFFVAAPRCYCVLTRVPFFELHFEMLNSIIAQERLNRITQFVNEMALADLAPVVSNSNGQLIENIDSSYNENVTNQVASAVPVDGAVAIAAAATGIESEDEIPPILSGGKPQSPESCITSETSDICQPREIDKYGRKNLHCLDDCVTEALGIHTDSLYRIYGSYDNGQTPEFGPHVIHRSHTFDHRGCSESLFSSVRSMWSEDDNEIFFGHDRTDAGNEMIREWARDNNNDLLQIVCSYHAMALPARGSKIVFQPLEHLQAIEYLRPPVSSFGLSERELDLMKQDRTEAVKVNLTLAAAEEAVALSLWTTATVCRVLSLESVLALVSGVLLEKQVVVVCPNLGVLSAVVLSLIPMIRPFQWQSLFLPVLPVKMLDFLDAPVPFIVGVQHKPADWKMKATNLVRVNVLKDQVKLCNLPTLPRQKELISALAPIHTRLSCESHIARGHPVYRCNTLQAEAASQFLTVMRCYLESFCLDLRAHTITSVQSNSDRVSLLLKDSFIDSFPSKDQPFIKLFIDTQLFTVLSDSRLSSYENGYS